MSEYLEKNNFQPKNMHGLNFNITHTLNMSNCSFTKVYTRLRVPNKILTYVDRVPHFFP